MCVYQACVDIIFSTPADHESQPRNFFTDIEQAAFSPSNMVPGIAPSADPSSYSTYSALEKHDSDFLSPYY